MSKHSITNREVNTFSNVFVIVRVAGDQRFVVCKGYS